MPKIKYLVVHHTAGSITETVEEIKQYALTQDYTDIPYNRLIDKKGKVYQGRSDDKEPAHALGLNHYSLGICCIGDYSKYKPSEAMIKSLIQTLAILCKRYKISVNNIIGHRDVAKIVNKPQYATTCPSENIYSLLPMIREKVQKYL